jgi:hypothetical protein
MQACYNGATKEETTMRKKTHKQQLSTDDLLKTKTMDIELTEKELGQVTGGDKSTVVTYTGTKYGGLTGKDGSPITLPIGTKA